MKLGVYMIVKNEGQVLDTCLRSLKGFDEIVILDTGSVDNTRDIAKKFDCKYIENEYKWNDNFAEARNKALKYSTSDWVLVIDADEIFEGDVNKLRKKLETSKELCYNVDTEALKNKGHIHQSVRLHKRCREVYWKGAIHNFLNITGRVNMPGIKVKYGYSPAHSLDPDRALRILQKEVKRDPKLSREKYYLAREYYYRKDYKLAIYYFEWYVESSQFAKEKADAYIYLARCHYALGNIDISKDMCLQSIKINANLKEAWNLLASLSGPKNQKTLIAMSKLATNEDVLFIRT